MSSMREWLDIEDLYDDEPQPGDMTAQAAIAWEAFTEKWYYEQKNWVIVENKSFNLHSRWHDQKQAKGAKDWLNGKARDLGVKTRYLVFHISILKDPLAMMAQRMVEDE